MKREIHYIATLEDQVKYVFGFGSYFKGKDFNDIDIMFVVNDFVGDLSPFFLIRNAVSSLSDYLEIRIDFVYVTKSEFDEQPLRDHEGLSLLYQSDK